MLFQASSNGVLFSDKCRFNMLQIVYIWHDVKLMPSVYTFTNMTSPCFPTKMRKAIYRNIPYVLWIWYDTVRVNHWLCMYIYIYMCICMWNICKHIYIYIIYIYTWQNWIFHIGNANKLVLRDEILTSERLISTRSSRSPNDVCWFFKSHEYYSSKQQTI